VDIYLILDKSTLSNINPRFESTPSMSQAEIFSLLGQNILPDSINSPTSVSSFASLAFATTQTISKLGFINTDTIFSIDKTIREALNLDTLSFRSNILQNILFDTLPGSFLDDDLSPLAKYLDGTTIYIGKNLGYNLYLQGTLQFTGINSHYSNYTNKFLSDDLQLNLETSLDWDNEIGTFEVFSQPDELSVFNIFDNIGFSVTKTLKF